MRNVKVFYMITLDGRLIKPYINFELLNNLPNPSNTSWGYRKFVAETDIIIMDEKDYFEIINMGVKWPYPGKLTYLVTNQQQIPTFTNDVKLLTPKDLTTSISELKKSGSVWLIGERIKNHALKHDCVDMISLLIIPLHVKQDEQFQIDTLPANVWNVTDHELYDNGVMRIVYEKQQPQS